MLSFLWCGEFTVDGIMDLNFIPYFIPSGSLVLPLKFQLGPFTISPGQFAPSATESSRPEHPVKFLPESNPASKVSAGSGTHGR